MIILCLKMGRIIWSYLCLYTDKMALESFTAAYGEGELHVWVKGYEKDYLPCTLQYLEM